MVFFGRKSFHYNLSVCLCDLISAEKKKTLEFFMISHKKGYMLVKYVNMNFLFAAKEAIKTSSIEQLIFAVIGLLVAFTGFIGVKTRQIKKSVDQVNNAVNHVGPGGRTLTDRVDRIEETLVVVQYDQTQIKTNIVSLGDKIDSANTKSEEVLKSHVETKKKIDELITKIPKRKND